MCSFCKNIGHDIRDCSIAPTVSDQVVPIALPAPAPAPVTEPITLPPVRRTVMRLRPPSRQSVPFVSVPWPLPVDTNNYIYEYRYNYVYTNGRAEPRVSTHLRPPYSQSPPQVVAPPSSPVANTPIRHNVIRLRPPRVPVRQPVSTNNEIEVLKFDEECDTNEECPICYENLKNESFVKLNCAHTYCKSCIKECIDKRLFNCSMCRVRIETVFTQNPNSVYCSTEYTTVCDVKYSL